MSHIWAIGIVACVNRRKSLEPKLPPRNVKNRRNYFEGITGVPGEFLQRKARTIQKIPLQLV